MSHPLCLHATAENTKILTEIIPADFRIKLLIFRIIFSVLVLQSSGKVGDIELIPSVSMDVSAFFMVICKAYYTAYSVSDLIYLQK